MQLPLAYLVFRATLEFCMLPPPFFFAALFLIHIHTHTHPDDRHVSLWVCGVWFLLCKGYLVERAGNSRYEISQATSRFPPSLKEIPEYSERFK